jgi:hypothetical protein
MTVKNINILTAGSAALHDTDDGPKRCEYLRKINFIKKLQLRILWFSGANGKMTHGKYLVKNLVTLSL